MICPLENFQIGRTVLIRTKLASFGRGGGSVELVLAAVLAPGLRLLARAKTPGVS